MEQVIQVSHQIWEAIRNVDEAALKKLVHPDAMFIHMGVSLPRDEEIRTLQEGKIVNKEITFEDGTVREFDAVVILYHKLKVTAVVLGEEVTNPFVVTEVYEKNTDGLRLLSLSYTRINY